MATKIEISTINPPPTEEVLEFAESKNAVSIAVDSYTTTWGVIWACYDSQDRLVGKCDATGAEQ